MVFEIQTEEEEEELKNLFAISPMLVAQFLDIDLSYDSESRKCTGIKTLSMPIIIYKSTTVLCNKMCFLWSRFIVV